MQRIKYSDQHLACLEKVKESITREDLDDSHIKLKNVAIEIQENIRRTLIVVTDEKGDGKGDCKLTKILQEAPGALLDTLYAMNLERENLELYEGLIYKFFYNLSECLEISKETREYFWNKAKARRYFKCSNTIYC